MGVPGPPQASPDPAVRGVSSLTARRAARHWQTRPVDFDSAYAQGFARVAACTLPTVIADPHANAEAVLEQARGCDEEGVAVAMSPELA